MHSGKILTGSLLVLFIVVLPAHAQDLSHLRLIAHYPLTVNAEDTLGNYDSLDLLNIIFKDGGIYCNGIYPGGDPNGCNVRTPFLEELNMQSFAAQVDFRIDTAYTELHSLLVGGLNWRWLSVWLQSEGFIGLYDVGRWTPYALNTWQTVTLIYDSTAQRADLYLDDVLADSTLNKILNHHNQKYFTTTNGSIGKTYKGLLRNLKIYSYIECCEVPSSVPSDPALFSNYPNPFNPETTIRFSIRRPGRVRLSIYDTRGREVRRLVDGDRNAGGYAAVWEGRDSNGSLLPSGIYICRLEAPESVRTLKINLCR